MAWWLTALLWVGSVAVNRIFRPKLNVEQQHAAPEAFQGIEVEDGRPIPVLFGTRQIKNLNIGWNGDQSQTAIVEGASTIGYKYYLGGHYPMCTGPIDAVQELRWNEKSVGSGVTSADNQIMFGLGTAPWDTAFIATGNYPDGATLAAACEAAMKAAVPGDWRVTFGFQIVSGVNDQVKFQVDGGTVRTITLTPGTYSGATLATHVTNKLNASPGIPSGNQFACTYNGVTFKFNISLDTVPIPGGPWSWTSWTLNTSNAKSTLGFQHNIDHTATAPVVSVTSGYAVLAGRFIFAYGGTTATLAVTDAGFTAATLLGLSTAADRTLGIYSSDSDFSVIAATYTETTDYLQVDIDDPDFFGTEGGVQGRLDIYWGKLTQAASSYLTTEFGSTAPNWPGVAHLVQRGMYVGNTNFPKPISVTPRRCPNQLGLTDERHIINGDANPAAMIYEILTDQRWGLKKSASEIDTASFLEVGETLAEEGLGLSMLLDAVGPARDVIDEILRHVDGVRQNDPATGLFKLKLIRNDYDPNTIPVASSELGNVTACSLKRRSWGDTKNVVRVRYVDRDADYQERVVEVQNLANIQARGGEMAIEELSLPGFSRRATAEIAARRILRAASWPIADLALEVNREFWQLRKGDPFLLTWAPLGITAMPCRVTRVRTGRLEDGRIGIDAVEDLAGAVWTGFSGVSAPANDAAEPLDITPGELASDAVLVGGVPMPGA